MGTAAPSDDRRKRHLDRAAPRGIDLHRFAGCARQPVTPRSVVPFASGGIGLHRATFDSVMSSVPDFLSTSHDECRSATPHGIRLRRHHLHGWSWHRPQLELASTYFSGDASRCGLTCGSCSFPMAGHAHRRSLWPAPRVSLRGASRWTVTRFGTGPRHPGSQERVSDGDGRRWSGGCQRPRPRRQSRSVRWPAGCRSSR
jgi:hypothetical protein